MDSPSLEPLIKPPTMPISWLYCIVVIISLLIFGWQMWKGFKVAFKIAFRFHNTEETDKKNLAAAAWFIALVYAGYWVFGRI